MHKELKIIGIAIVFLIFASICSFISAKIQTGTDNTNEETIGVIKHYGFPIKFISIAPGLSWPQWNGKKLLLNTFLWWLFFIAIWRVISRIRRNKIILFQQGRSG